MSPLRAAMSGKDHHDDEGHSTSLKQGQQIHDGFPGSFTAP